MNVTHLYIRRNHKLARADLIEVRKEVVLKSIEYLCLLFTQKTETGAERLRTDAIHPLTGQMLPIFVSNEADFGPKIRADLPMLNVQIGIDEILFLFSLVQVLHS